MSDRRDTYLVQHIREALAADERTGQLDVEVAVANGRLVVSGTVSTAERRDAIGELVAELAGDLEVHNAVEVEELHPAESTETIL